MQILYVCSLTLSITYRVVKAVRSLNTPSPIFVRSFTSRFLIMCIQKHDINWITHFIPNLYCIPQLTLLPPQYRSLGDTNRASSSVFQSKTYSILLPVLHHCPIVHNIHRSIILAYFRIHVYTLLSYQRTTCISLNICHWQKLWIVSHSLFFFPPHSPNP